MEGSSEIRILWVVDALGRATLPGISGSRFRSTWVSTYEAGLHALAGGQHDICLIDELLGPRDGLDLLREARARGVRAPMILLIGQADRAAAGIDAGAADCLIKHQIGAPLLERMIPYTLAHTRVLEMLHASEERYALLARGANDGLWNWDLRNGRIELSPRWKALLGYAEHELGDDPGAWLDLAHPDDRQPFEQAIAAHCRGETPHLEAEIRMRHKNGGQHWVLVRGCALWDADGFAHRIAGSQTDITMRKAAEERLAHSALYDALTGLPNRALLIERLRRAIERARRHAEYRFAVLFLDFDRFKVINDSLGHTFGDQLLIEIARRLESCLRTEDTVARLGGDEFGVLIDYIVDMGDAVQVAERIQRALAEPFELGGQELFTSVSIGIALSMTSYEQPETVLRDADTAMNRAKAGGRARYELFDSEMHARVAALLRIENDLRRALERGEFEIHYQPIVALTGGRLIGFEALVRWRHPQRGLIGPGEFLPVAEETGLIATIDWWVLRQACRQLAAWQTTFPAEQQLSVSVNLSSRDFSRPDLAERIAQELRDAGLAGSSLRLEITESAIMEHSEVAATMLQRLRELGVQVYIDDFGTGYSSLSYLHRFPVDTLKIDRSFVSRMDAAGQNAKIIQTILTLARDLGMNVIAEGVETSEQCDHLRALRCEYAQGFFFSRPLNGAAAAALLAERCVGS